MSKSTSEDIKPSWDAPSLIAEKLKLKRRSVQVVVNLLDEGATIPFIARYRKDQTEDMSPETIRDVSSEINELR